MDVVSPWSDARAEMICASLELGIKSLLFASRIQAPRTRSQGECCPSQFVPISRDGLEV